ncbi:GNAT family N-acetyltransferase [Paracidovorax sp. MALMAid1276]|uniref:GNAT family N-acetyltransferase n=1 Tax=Paracidovorax sp. MALMAid1276 TaxID=3411631 RepID=UPI003B99547B
MSVVVRPLALSDLPGLLAVQLACYGEGFVESGEVFARRLASPANCSLVLLQAGAVCAYLAAYRSVRGKVTPLHGDFEASPGADTLYLHDMAVLPACAGRGLAGQLLQPLWAQAVAQGLRHSALVSVQGTQPYWERHGYLRQRLPDAAQRTHLASYGEGAVYMARALQAPRHPPSS